MATNVIASPERRPTGTPTARAKNGIWACMENSISFKHFPWSLVCKTVKASSVHARQSRVFILKVLSNVMTRISQVSWVKVSGIRYPVELVDKQLKHQQ